MAATLWWSLRGVWGVTEVLCAGKTDLHYWSACICTCDAALFGDDYFVKMPLAVLQCVLNGVVQMHVVAVGLTCVWSQHAQSGALGSARVLAVQLDLSRGR